MIYPNTLNLIKKILHCTPYFQLSSRCLNFPDETLSLLFDILLEGRGLIFNFNMFFNLFYGFSF